MHHPSTHRRIDGTLLRAATLGVWLFADAVGVPISQALIPPVESFPQARDLSAIKHENARLKKLLANLQGAVHGQKIHTTVSAKASASAMLTRARLEQIGGTKRQVLITFVNKARLDFATTWAAHVRRLGMKGWLVGATDDTAMEHLVKLSIPCFHLHTSLPTSDWGWGTGSFHALGPVKARSFSPDARPATSRLRRRARCSHHAGEADRHGAARHHTTLRGAA